MSFSAHLLLTNKQMQHIFFKIILYDEYWNLIQWNAYNLNNLEHFQLADSYYNTMHFSNGLVIVLIIYLQRVMVNASFLANLWLHLN